MNAHFLDSAIRQITTTSISGYQKYISPRKGFSCAHRLLYGDESCSQYVKRIVAQHGLAAGVKASRKRFQACREANQILRARYARYHSYASQSREEEKQPNKLKRKISQCSDDCSSNCSNGDCDGMAACCTTDWGSCDMPDCGHCNSGIDCGTIDCGSGLDCGGLDCGSGLDCGGLDCGGCG